MRIGPPVSELPIKEVLHSGILSNRKGSCIVLLMRHLGDAVIASGVINSLHRHSPNLAVDVLGRPGLEQVITSFSSIREYVGADFPVFGHHRRDIATLSATFHTMRMIRKSRYDYCINLIGDVRENLIGVLTGAKWNIAPVWERGHLFKRKMTDTGAAWLTNCGIFIPSTHSSFYDSMQYFANQLGLSELEWRRISDRKDRTEGRTTVALHPGASHASRHWPEDRWRALLRELHLQGYKVRVLGSPLERSGLLVAFGKEIADQGIEIVTEEVPGFVSCLASADVLIGMDSFSVHAAYALGVPVVVLNGSADPSILTPPGGAVTSAGHLCKHFPCYYKYPCQGTDGEYICVRGIEVSAVMNALDSLVVRRHVVHGDTS